MENSTMKTICTHDMNYTCWRNFAVGENQRYSDQMTPVIVMMIVFLMVGIPGNLVVFMMYFTRTQRTSANTFIMFLAGIDLFACIFIHPYIVYKLYNFYDQTWTVTCKIFEFLIHLNLAMSGLTLLLVAIDRYLAICKPVKFLLFDRNIVKGIVSVTGLSIVISLPLLEFYGPNPHPYQFTDGIFVSYRCDFQPVYQGSVFYVAFSSFVMTGFIVEIIVLSVLYKRVAVVAYRSHRAVLPLSNAHILAGIQSAHSASSEAGPSQDTSHSTRSGTLSRSTDISAGSPGRLPLALAPIYNQLRASRATQPFIQNTQVDIFTARPACKMVSLSEKTESTDSHTNDSRRNERADGIPQSDGNPQPGGLQVNSNRLKNKLKAAKLLFLVTFVFFLSWMPFFILRICYTLDKGACLMDSYTGKVVDNMLNHVFYINNAINPILYTVLNKTFRNEFSMIMKKKCRCCYR